MFFAKTFCVSVEIYDWRENMAPWRHEELLISRGWGTNVVNCDIVINCHKHLKGITSALKQTPNREVLSYLEIASSMKLKVTT